MSIKPLGHHYSMENPASVYDEEALTALELAGRTTAKVNEVVAYVNQLPEHIRKGVAEKILEFIQDGTFNKVITDHYNLTVDGKLDELETRLNGIVASSGNDNTEIVDMRMGADRTEYNTAGEAVRKQFHILAEATENPGVVTVQEADTVKGEYYHNETGNIIQDNTGVFARSAHLYPSKPGQLYTVESANGLESTHKLYLSCYSRDMTFLGYTHPFGGPVKTLQVKPTPPKTAYIGVSVGAHYSGDIILRELDNVTTQGIAYPFPDNGKQYVVKDNTFMNGNGVLTYEYNTYSVCMFKTAGIKSIYVNSTLLYNAMFIDANGGIISNGSEFEVHGLGRLYHVPSNAVIVGINLPKSGIDEKGNTTAYIGLTLEKGGALNGKKVLCIGDSITWLDGRNVTEANNTQLVGWQGELRKRGAIVDTIAYSGAGYGAIGELASLYNLIQQNNPEANLEQDYDAVVLFAGTNDIANNTPYKISELYRVLANQAYDSERVGNEYFEANRPDDHWRSPDHWEGDYPIYHRDGTSRSSTEFFEWGVHALVKWVYETYPNASIYLCLPMFRASNPGIAIYDNYHQGIICEAHASACQVIDLYHKAGVANHNYTRAYYDGVHPNRETMGKIGRIIANEIEGSI